MIRFRVIRGFFKKELPQVLRDKKMAAVIFILPLIQLILFGFALTNEVKNISVSFSYEPDDYLMNKIEHNMTASKWFKESVAFSGADYVGALVTRKAEAVLVSPPGGLAKAIERNDARIQLLIDASNAQRAQQIEAYIVNIVNLTLSEEYNIEQGAAVSASIKVLYNPSLESSFFMIPALMGFVLSIVTVLITSMSLAKERESGTLEKLISSPVSVEEILLGKTLPYVLISFIIVPLMLCFGVFVFGIPVQGGIIKIFAVCLIFIISSCSVAIFISTFAKTQQQAMMGSVMFLFPAMLLSGLVFPVENIPVIVKWVTYINPLYYLSLLLRNIMLKGGDLIFMAKGCGALLVIGLCLAFISLKKFSSKLN